jgi:tRNA-2-methylthio-N6-dimethylallyladenosine synthase
VGRLRSKPVEVCVGEYRRLLADGCRRFTILADNVGAYGLDIGTTFSELIDALSAASGETEVQWFISQLHPRWLLTHRPAMLKVAREGRLRELLCAIQSGSDRILALMNRHHRIEETVEALSELRAIRPDLRLDTEVIIGFPGESEDDFGATLEAVRRIRFDHVALFPYYDGQGTAASRMDGKVGADTIGRRLARAMAVLSEAGITFRCDQTDRP